MHLHKPLFCFYSILLFSRCAYIAYAGPEVSTLKVDTTTALPNLRVQGMDEPEIDWNLCLKPDSGRRSMTRRKATFGSFQKQFELALGEKPGQLFAYHADILDHSPLGFVVDPQGSVYILESDVGNHDQSDRPLHRTSLDRIGVFSPRGRFLHQILLKPFLVASLKEDSFKIIPQQIFQSLPNTISVLVGVVWNKNSDKTDLYLLHLSLNGELKSLVPIQLKHEQYLPVRPYLLDAEGYLWVRQTLSSSPEGNYAFFIYRPDGAFSHILQKDFDGIGQPGYIYKFEFAAVRDAQDHYHNCTSLRVYDRTGKVVRQWWTQRFKSEPRNWTSKEGFYITQNIFQDPWMIVWDSADKDHERNCKDKNGYSCRCHLRQENFRIYRLDETTDTLALVQILKTIPRYGMFVRNDMEECDWHPAVATFDSRNHLYLLRYLPTRVEFLRSSMHPADPQ